MLLHSMEHTTVEESTPRQISNPSSSSTASVFSSVLDIILLEQKAGSAKLITSDSQKALRLTCKASRSVIDAHVATVKLPDNPADHNLYWAWSWANLREVDLLDLIFTLEDIEAFVSFNIPQLRSLSISCRNILPLCQSNWPELESLNLDVFNNETPEDFYPTDWHLPTWPLKKLSLAVENWKKVDFLLPLIASKSWFANLEYLDMRHLKTVPGTQLNVALKALSSSVKTLILHGVNCEVLREAWEGIKFDNLEVLELQDLFSPSYNAGVIIEVSQHINALFDSCATSAFPKLLELSVGHEVEEEADEELLNLPEWHQAPTKSILDQCPVLKQITLTGFLLEHDAVRYLGKFRKVTGGRIDLHYSCVALFHLSLARRAYLQTLDISEYTWDKFCYEVAGTIDYTDCFCFNCMSDLRFQRLADAFMYGTDIPQDSELDQSGIEEVELEPIYDIYQIVV
jgi:hypothetical protein